MAGTKLFDDTWEHSARSRFHQIARQLPFGELYRAVAIGLAQPDVALRSDLILGLCDRLHLRTSKSRLWTPAEIAEEETELEGFKAARRIAGSIVGMREVDELLAPVRLMWSSPEHARWLSELLPDAPISRLEPERVLDEVASIDHEVVRARTLGLLSPLMHPTVEAMQLVQGISNGLDRARLLGVMGLSLGGSGLREAVTTAQKIEDADARAVAVGALAPHLGYPQGSLRSLVKEAITDVANAPPDAAKGRAFAALTPVVHGLLPELQQYVAREVARLESDEARRLAVEALTIPWPQPYKADAASPSAPMFRTLVDTVRDIASKPEPEDVLRDLRAMAAASSASAPPVNPGGGEQSAEARIREGPVFGGAAGAPGGTRAQPERVVSLGFAPDHAPRQSLPRTTTLAAHYKYVFWVEIGARQADSIVDKPESVLPDEILPQGATLDVALYHLAAGIQINPHCASGELTVAANGTVYVSRQPGDAFPRTYEDLRSRRLLFPVSAPGEEGWARLRCNTYYRGNLVQSHLVSAMVARVPHDDTQSALSAIVDYTLAPSLGSRHLQELQPQQLSLMMNRNADGSHAFMFYGAGEGEPFREECQLQAHDLQHLVKIGRKALRTAAWGNAKPWRKASQYRYGGPPDRQRLLRDLENLATAGYRIYAALIDDLAGHKEKAERLAAIMRRSGFVQIALKEKAQHVFPAAMLYDYPLDTNAKALTVCPAFLGAIDAGAPLNDTSCFTTGCEHHSLTQLCPSGFWGYRHALGLPLSTAHSPDVPTTLGVAAGAEFTVLVSTDPEFEKRDDHLKEIRRICAPARWKQAETRDDAFLRLKDTLPHLVYCYVHGGVTTHKLPYIEVGAPNSGGAILSDNLRAYQIQWTNPRPLVFLNGCHTTSLEPEVAINLVSAFVETCEAAGVIGTEITVFEALACTFAEECLRAFFVEKLPIGESVRRARLALLGQQNPLGLVYIPFVQTGLKVVA